MNVTARQRFGWGLANVIVPVIASSDSGPGPLSSTKTSKNDGTPLMLTSIGVVEYIVAAAMVTSNGPALESAA